MALSGRLGRRELLGAALLAAAASACGLGGGLGGGRGDRAERRRRRRERREARADAAPPAPPPPSDEALAAHAAAAASLASGDVDAATAQWSAACAAGHPEACRMEVRWTRRKALGIAPPSMRESP